MIEAGWSPSVRLFEAAACGTPIISDAWRGLDELFADGEAILIAHGTKDVVKALTEVGEQERQAISEAAKTRVLQSHTGVARARQLASALEQLPIRTVPQAGDLRDRVSA
jgi:spore maturation protein CgeB